MRKIYFLTTLLAILIISCQTKQKSLEAQLTDNFLAHLKKADSLLKLDSFKIVRIDSITEKVGQIIYDSIYSHEKATLEMQINSARKHNNTDSIEFVQYEIDYMKKEIDSITSAINNADTVKKYGIIAACAYTLTKNTKSKSNFIYYFINPKEGIMNSDMIDDFIKGADDQLK